MEPRPVSHPKRAPLKNFATDIATFKQLPMLYDGRGGVWCNHRRLVCCICPTDNRTFCLVGMFPAECPKMLDKWLEDQCEKEEVGMLEAFEAVMKRNGNKWRRQDYTETIKWSGKTVLAMSARSNALFDFVTEDMWRAPDNLLLREG